jgi:hypothetical protein
MAPPAFDGKILCVLEEIMSKERAKAAILLENFRRGLSHALSARPGLVLSSLDWIMSM